MIASLNVRENEIGKWAGIAVSVFSLAQCVTAIAWGRASDRWGRKPIILLGLTSTMITSVLWGFSTSLTMAIVVRILAGAGNGNVGIIRTTVAEMVPWKELQPRAFSIMPLVWNIGSIFGPTLGGALANPYNIEPGQKVREDAGLLERFPYALPNLVAAVLFLVGITTGILFLDESLETQRNRRDYGRDLGRLISFSVKSAFHRVAHFARRGRADEYEPLLKPNGHGAESDEETLTAAETKKPALPPPSMKEVLNRQSVLNLVVYAFLALHNLGFDQLLPIFMHHPPQDHSPANPDYVPPFKFSGGFGLNSAQIGFLFTLYGVSGMIIQFGIFPPIARKYGVVRCLRWVSVALPFIYFVVPFTALLPDKSSQQVVVFIIMILKGFCTTFAFPCSTILLTNSASSLRVLGTLNGVATSVSAIGRAAGPAIGGSTFTLGVKHGWVIAPWWLLAAIAALAAIPVFWVVEGEGFGGDDEVEDSDDEEESEVEDEARIRRKSSALPTALEEVGEEQEEGYGTLAPLSRTNTASSAALTVGAGDDETESMGTPQGPSRRGSEIRRRSSRRMSIPIGMGNGISRRYSSNLGQSLGSAGSFGG